MKPSFLDLLRSLHAHGVDFVVVGGVAALIEGAPITTLDLDVVFRVEEENVSRLLRALEELNAQYRDPAGRHILPTRQRLEDNQINLLDTSAGSLDALQEIGDAWRFEDLVERSKTRRVGNLEVLVLDLEAVVESKEVANRPKDHATLPVLRATLQEIRKASD